MGRYLRGWVFFPSVAVEMQGRLFFLFPAQNSKHLLKNAFPCDSSHLKKQHKSTQNWVLQLGRHASVWSLPWTLTRVGCRANQVTRETVQPEIELPQSGCLGLWGCRFHLQQLHCSISRSFQAGAVHKIDFILVPMFGLVLSNQHVC